MLKKLTSITFPNWEYEITLFRQVFNSIDTYYFPVSMIRTEAWSLITPLVKEKDLREGWITIRNVPYISDRGLRPFWSEEREGSKDLNLYWKHHMVWWSPNNPNWYEELVPESIID